MNSPATSTSITLQPGVPQTITLTIGALSISVTLAAAEALDAQLVVLPGAEIATLPSGEGAAAP